MTKTPLVPLLALVLVLAIGTIITGTCATDETIYVQLQWYFEASATSVWMPQALGYYFAENLTVAINQGGPNINVENYVQKEVADIGFGCLAVMLTSYRTGDPDDEMIAIAQVDQTSSYRLVTLKSSGINTLRDMQDKRVCLWTTGGQDLTPRAALAAEGVTYQTISLGSTPYVLLAGDCDVIEVMSYNELGLLLQMVNPATGSFVTYDDINIFDLGEEAFAMENIIFVRKSWLAVPTNQERILSFLRAVVRTAIFARDNPTAMLNYYNPSSPVDQWQLYVTNQMAWANASHTNRYGHVNPAQVDRTIENVKTYMYPTLNVSNVFDNYYIDIVVAELKSEGYVFNIEMPTERLSWCVDVGAKLPHVCRGDERTQKVTMYDARYRIFNITLSVVLLSATLIVTVFTIINRNKLPILRAAPNYLYMMLGGACMMYIGSIVYNLGVTVSSCHVYIWGVSLGFTFLFAPYICKTYRIYRICDMSTVEIKRQEPLLFASLMIAAVLVNLILLVLFSSLKPVTTTPVVSPFDIYVLYRTCHWNSVMGYIIIAYTAVLLIGAVWLAFLNRNNKFKYINDSGDMSAAAFLTTAIVAFTLGVVLLQSNPNTSILIQSLGLCVVGSMNTALMFVRRLYHCLVLEESELQQRYKGETGSSTNSTNTRRHHSSEVSSEKWSERKHNYSKTPASPAIPISPRNYSRHTSSRSRSRGEV